MSFVKWCWLLNHWLKQLSAVSHAFRRMCSTFAPGSVRAITGRWLKLYTCLSTHTARSSDAGA